MQDVDEKLLYDTFSAFGVIVTNPKVNCHFQKLPLAFNTLERKKWGNVFLLLFCFISDVFSFFTWYKIVSFRAGGLEPEDVAES